MGDLIKYEIVNEHAPWSISSTSELHAAVAVILLGEGKFGLRTRERRFGGKPARIVCPPFFLSGATGLEDWWSEQLRERKRMAGYESLVDFDGPDGFERWVQNEKRGIADALDTLAFEGAERFFPNGDLRFEARILSNELRGKVAQES